MVVRTDNKMGSEFAEAEEWKSDSTDIYNFIREVKVGDQVQRIVSSQSGHERNHFFINLPDSKFDDVSLISGLDTLADSRAFAIWDFNHDGWQDIALVNANDPFFQIYINQMESVQAAPSRFVALKLVGGNDTMQASEQWSNRDAIGAIIEVKTNKQTYVRELRAGEGFASQNSKVKLIGIAQDSDPELTVYWPSGKTRSLGKIPTGKLITVYENASQTFSPGGMEHQPYEPPAGPLANSKVKPIDKFQPEFPSNNDADLNVFVSMATWCANCKKNQPGVALLKSQLGKRINLFGVPVDAEDTAEKLDSYIDKYKPAYQILKQIDKASIQSMEKIVTSRSGQGGLPSSVVTDSNGNVLLVTAGLPTYSEIRKLLSELATASNGEATQE